MQETESKKRLTRTYKEAIKVNIKMETPTHFHRLLVYVLPQRLSRIPRAPAIIIIIVVVDAKISKSSIMPQRYLVGRSAQIAINARDIVRRCRCYRNNNNI